MNPNNELLQAAKEVLAAESEVLVPFDGMDTHDVVAFRLRKDERRQSALAALQDAIARAEASASQPAPDEQREKAIKEAMRELRSAAMDCGASDITTPEGHAKIDRLNRADALVRQLLRSAPPAPAVPSEDEIEAFLPPFDHCVSARDVAQQLGFELKDGYLSPKDQAIVEHAATCIEDIMRRAAGGAS